MCKLPPPRPLPQTSAATSQRERYDSDAKKNKTERARDAKKTTNEAGRDSEKHKPRRFMEKNSSPPLLFGLPANSPHRTLLSSRAVPVSLALYRTHARHLAPPPPRHTPSHLSLALSQWYGGRGVHIGGITMRRLMYRSVLFVRLRRAVGQSARQGAGDHARVQHAARAVRPHQGRVRALRQGPKWRYRYVAVAVVAALNERARLQLVAYRRARSRSLSPPDASEVHNRFLSRL